MASSMLGVLGNCHVVSRSHRVGNSSYGNSSKQLIETTLDQLNQGNTEQVIENLESLEREVQPTYESRANYDMPVEQYVDRFDNR